MKESIIIKNLGPLKEVEISDIKPLTVFIGKSASGKSTICLLYTSGRWKNRGFPDDTSRKRNVSERGTDDIEAYGNRI